jgi:hypothetical protein
MKTSYKFWYVTKADNVHISEVAVRFYEGEITTEDELVQNLITREDVIKPVTRYRRIKQLTQKEVKHEKNRRVKKDMFDNDCFIYTDKDFGVTADLKDVSNYIERVLKKDKEREPIL